MSSLIKKRGISIKEKQTAQHGSVRESYTHHNTQIHAPKEKKFLYSNEGTIDYNQQCHPLHLENKQFKQFPQKKKKKKRVRTRRGGRRKRRRKGEGKRKRGRESEKKKEKEKKEEKEKEEEKMEKAVLKVHRSLQMHSLARS